MLHAGQAGAQAQALQQTGQGPHTPEEQRVERDGEQGRRDDGIADAAVEQAEADPQRYEDEGEFAYLPQRKPHGNGQTQRFSGHEADQEGQQGLEQHDDAQGHQEKGPLFQQGGGVEEHAYGHEEQHREGITQGQGLGGGTGAEIGLAYHHARQKGPEGHGRVEEQGRAHGDAQGEHDDRQREQVTGARARHIAQQGGDQALSGHEGEDRERGQLEQGLAQYPPDVAFSGAQDHGQEHQQQDGEQVFHHQPAQGHMAGRGVQHMVVGQDAGEHHGARHGDRHAEDRARPEREAPELEQEHAGQGRERDLHGGPAQGDAAHGQQVLEVKVQAHAEHEQDDADLGQLRGQPRIGHEARRMRPHQDARQQIAYQRRQTELLGHEAQDEGGAQASGEGQDQGNIVRHAHGRVLSSPGSHWAQSVR